MSKRTASLLAAAGAACLAAAAQAMMIDIPLPCLVAESDLVAVVSVTEAGPPAEMTLKVPDQARPAKGWFQRFKGTVTRTLRDAAAATAAPAETAPAAPTAEPRTIEWLAPCAEPAKPGAPVLHVADGPAWPDLKVGTAYVLILRRLPDRREYFLPAYPKNFRTAVEKNVAEVEAFADVDAWPWGEETGGLRVALVPSSPTATLYPARTGTPTVQVQVTVALRNTTAGPLAVNLYEWDRHLTVYVVAVDGAAVKYDMYSYLEQSRKRKQPFGPDAVEVIPAGEMLLIGPAGATKYGLGLHLPLTAGKWNIQAAYETNRKGAAKGGQPLWTGKVVSASAQIEVRPARR